MHLNSKSGKGLRVFAFVCLAVVGIVEAEMVPPLVGFWVDFDTEDRLVRDEHLGWPLVLGAGGMQRNPRVRCARNAIHVVRHSVDRQQLDDGNLASRLLAE